jgi:chemotaxis protein methyltransferase CheR
MGDEDCVRLLQAVLPRLGLRWSGYRRVRRTPCRRIARRMRELGLEDVAGYLAYLDEAPAEWAVLDRMLRIPISRLWRDRAVFEALASDLVPGLVRAALERGETTLRVWSAGCASGEEAYSVAIFWRLAVQPSFPDASDLRLDLLATDVDETMIARAGTGVYGRSSLRELPALWRDAALEPREEDLFRVRPAFREGVALRVADIRVEMPPGPFDLILCRNVAFTYFAAGLQRRVLRGLHDRLVPGGLLVTGTHERPPQVDGVHLEQVGALPIWRRMREGGSSDPPTPSRW